MHFTKNNAQVASGQFLKVAHLSLMLLVNVHVCRPFSLTLPVFNPDDWREPYYEAMSIMMYKMVVIDTIIYGEAERI